MYDDGLNEAPFNPVPPIVWVLVCAIMGVELMFQAAEAGFIGGKEGIGWRLTYSREFGFYDPIFEWMRETGRTPVEEIARFVGYLFIHYSLMHAALVCVFTLALGKFTAERLGQISVLVIFLASGILGAFGYGLILNEPNLLLGGYPAAYGLIGSFTWIMFLGHLAGGEKGIYAFRLIAIFMLIQLVWKLFFGGNNEWLAELLGFGVGFALAVLFTPGAIRLAMLRLRQR